MIRDKVKVETIDDIEDFYILGLPIKTQIGNCHFIKVKHYPKFYGDLQVVKLPKQYFVNEISKDKENKELLEEVNGLSLREIVFGFSDIKDVYTKLFSYFFKDEDALMKIQDDDEFMYYRSLILKLSCEKEETINPNPEIQRAIERSRRVKSQEGEGLAFADIVTSVSAIKGVSYEEINEMTLYQLYMDFHRIGQKFNYETSALFATVAEKVEIEGWSKHIDLFEDEKTGLTRDEFSQIAGTVQD